jgi:hypothetical protein
VAFYGVSPPVRSGAANPCSHDPTWARRAYSASHTNLEALRELDGARAELFRMREEHSYAISSASAGEAETRVLACELRLLALELLDAEAEREAAREAEASALSIARTYRRFAAQGASRLDEMRVGIEEVQVRLQRRVEELQMASREVLRLRALRTEIDASLTEADADHLRKIERWGRACTAVGLATAWMGPNPVSAVGLALGRSTRWALMHHCGHRGYDKVPNAPKRYHSKVFARGWRRLVDWPDWMIPAAWAFPRAWAVWEMKTATCSAEMGPCSVTSSVIESPSRYSITR